MKYTAAFCCLFLLISFNTSAQDTFLDTFIRKDGIYAQPSFEPREPRTLFAVASSKKKIINIESLLSMEASDRIRRYFTPAFGDQKKEPYTYFRVLHDLEGNDSAAYFAAMTELPQDYKTFFTGLFYLEKNRFGKALPVFEGLAVSADSLITRESAFWTNVTKKLLDDETEYNAVVAAYKELDHAVKEKLPGLISSMSVIHSPEYLFHKYLVLYNYNFRIKDYIAAGSVYDSLLAYTTHPKMKASLKKNKEAVEEMLFAKGSFIRAVDKKLYHYEIDYLYDHLEAWGMDTATGKEFAEEAGFKLNARYCTKTDSIFTRWLKDTAAGEPLSKFEVLSFLRTPLDKAGRRFVIVKLGFDNDDTYKKYLSFLEEFRSKPIRQSVYVHTGNNGEGSEYMLTRHFIAALYQRNDPVVKYEICLYLIEDAEGNTYAVDTLF